MGSLSADSIPTVDLSPFTSASKGDEASQQQAARELVDACHRLGFVNITGHGVPAELLDEAFAWTKRLFDMPLEAKMKAPHPKGNTPHRGYSAPGLEKVYSKADVEQKDGDFSTLRKVEDYKESYEIGSEKNEVDYNIWLPEEVYPGYRAFMLDFYWKCNDAVKSILEAFSVGLGVSEAEAKEILAYNDVDYHQLRLLHYPEVATEKLQKEVLARMPAHTDWGTFTLLFQDTCGGLELQDPHSKQFIAAAPAEGALTLNIGDMFQRITNDYFVSAKHRVSLPPASKDASGSLVTPARYSIPFFACCKYDTVIRTLPSFISKSNPQKYDPVAFQDYGAMVSQFQYAGGKEDS